MPPILVAATGTAIVSLASCAVVHDDTTCVAQFRLETALTDWLAPAVATTAVITKATPPNSRNVRMI